MLDLNPNWTPPPNWREMQTIDAHTGGEPLRVFLDGWPKLPGDTILARRRYAMEHYDHLRTATMWEPRGHADMYGCIITPPVTEDGHFGVLFLHNEGFSTMCGHGIIAVVTVALETGMMPPTGRETRVKIDTPAGRVSAVATLENHRVSAVRFRNVPSFVLSKNQVVELPGLGPVQYDIAFGGAFYAFVEAAPLGLTMAPEEFQKMIRLGMDIKRAVMAAHPIEHPDTDDADLNFLYGTIFTGAPLGEEAHSRNVCIFAEGEVDRSPTGTGVSARMALHYARGELALGETMIIESIVGSRFEGKAVAETRCGNLPAVIPEVSGSAHITGIHRFLIDPEDPFRSGFILR